MNAKYENLQSTIKRKYSFKYKPEFKETFKTDIENNQIIPLIIEVFEKLEWPIVYSNKTTVEAKRKNDWNKLTEKITVTKNASGRIEVHSKTLQGNFIDFGNNSKRTGLFIALFKKLASEYQQTGKLDELKTKLENENSWADYKIPSELPKPKVKRPPNLMLTLLGGLIIAILFGVIVAFLTVHFTYFIGVYELGLGLGIGYLFSQVLKSTNYLDFSITNIILGAIMVVMFITNQFTQYQIIISENNFTGLGFFEFMRLRIENGLSIKSLNTGWIGLILSYIFQMVFPFLIAVSQVYISSSKTIIEKIPKKVLEYAIYLFEMEKSESEVRALLAEKGWSKKSDQDDVIQAILEISGFNQMRRE